jgi:methionyl-tRNA synthetase
MALVLYCNDCKKVFVYNQHYTECKRCKKELDEIYKCDKCGILMDEDSYFHKEDGIECYELCEKCN